MSDLCRVWEAMHTCAVRAAFINKKRSLAKSKWNAQTPLRHAISLRVISLSSEKLFRSIFHFLVLPFNFRPLPSALFFLFSPLPSLLQSSYLATPTTKAATFDFHLSDLLILQLRIIFPMCYLKRRTYRLAHSLAITWIVYKTNIGKWGIYIFFFNHFSVLLRSEEFLADLFWLDKNTGHTLASYWRYQAAYMHKFTLNVAMSTRLSSVDFVSLQFHLKILFKDGTYQHEEKKTRAQNR